MNFLNFQGKNSGTYQGPDKEPLPVSLMQYIVHYVYGVSEPTIMRLNAALMKEYEGSEEGLKRKVLEKFLRTAQNTSETGIKFIPHGIVLSPKAAENLIDFVYHVEGYRGARMAVGPCICQVAAKRPPDGIDEIEYKDITLFYGADIYKDMPMGHKEVNAEEAKEICRQMHERGHVHNAFYLFGKRSGLFVLCNCDKDLCQVVHGTRVMGPGLTDEKGPEVTKRDESKCLGPEQCGMCVKRCPFGANKIVNGKVVFNRDKCMGCGVCIETCKGCARELEERKDYAFDNILNRTLLLAGKYGRPELEIVDFKKEAQHE